MRRNQYVTRSSLWGGILVKSSLRAQTETVHCDERYIVMRVGNCLLVNVYLPCIGSADRQLICDNMLDEICSWREHCTDCQVVAAGDLNVRLDKVSDSVADSVKSFVQDLGVIRCDDIFPTQKKPTYVNFALNQESQIDYILTSNSRIVVDFRVLDPDINFSDHLPLLATVTCDACKDHLSRPVNRAAVVKQKKLRWDHGDLPGFYNFTGTLLPTVLLKLDSLISHYR